MEKADYMRMIDEAEDYDSIENIAENIAANDDGISNDEFFEIVQYGVNKVKYWREI